MKPETMHKLKHARANGGVRLNVDEAAEVLADLEAVAPAPSAVKAVVDYATKHVRGPSMTKRRRTS